MNIEYRERLHHKVLYATTNEKCYRITAESSNEVQALQCKQEEAGEKTKVKGDQ